MTTEILWVIALALLFYIAFSVSQIITSIRAGRPESEALPREIQVVVAGPDDLLIFRSTVTLKGEQRTELRDVLLKACLGRKVFVVENGIHLEAVVQGSPQIGSVAAK